MPAVEPTQAYQKILHRDVCNIWEPDALEFEADGEPHITTFTLIATGQKCRFYTRPSTSSPKPFGRYEDDMIFTLDVVRFPAGVVIDDGYVLKFTSAGDNLNTFWIVMGEPTSRRRLNLRQVYVKRLPSAPAGVS